MFQKLKHFLTGGPTPSEAELRDALKFYMDLSRDAAKFLDREKDYISTIEVLRRQLLYEETYQDQLVKVLDKLDPEWENKLEEFTE